MDQPPTPIPPPNPLEGYKKILATLVAVAAYVAARWGWNVDQGDLVAALSPLLVYVIAQGQADHGKEAAKIDARANAVAQAAPAAIDDIAAIRAEIADLRKIFAAGIATSPSVTTPKAGA